MGESTIVTRAAGTVILVQSICSRASFNKGLSLIVDRHHGHLSVVSIQQALQVITSNSSRSCRVSRRTQPCATDRFCPILRILATLWAAYQLRKSRCKNLTMLATTNMLRTRCTWLKQEITGVRTKLGMIQLMFFKNWLTARLPNLRILTANLIRLISMLIVKFSAATTRLRGKPVLITQYNSNWKLVSKRMMSSGTSSKGSVANAMSTSTLRREI